MLTVEIRINGSIIAAIEAVNRGPVTVGGIYRYEYQGFTFPIDNSGPAHAVHGFVEHRRSDGAAKLVALLSEAVSKGIAAK
jgi:hypothetical protein